MEDRLPLHNVVRSSFFFVYFHLVGSKFSTKYPDVGQSYQLAIAKKKNITTFYMQLRCGALFGTTTPIATIRNVPPERPSGPTP